MSTNIRLFVFFNIIIAQYTHGINLQTLQHCCGIGNTYGESGIPCGSYPSPIPNVDKQDESHCLKSIDVCCKNKYRENQCSLGQNDAVNGKECTSSRNISTDDFKKDCCSACQLGIETGSSGQSCDTIPGLGSPYDDAFTTCCKNKPPTSQKTILTSTTLFTSTQTPSTTERMIPDDNYPPLENICEFSDVCAQICIPSGDSYRCDCEEGYSLMADGVSCKATIKKLPAMPGPHSHPHPHAHPSITPVDRCNENNPCEHECKDTGVSIQCSCYEGFELDKDKVSCNDVDECQLGLHECLPSQKCFNEPGSYNCGNDIEDYNMCPQGYVFNAEKQVCDDFDECQVEIVCESHQTCVNTVGGYECKDEVVKCPPGFFFKDSIQDCEDVDECILGQHDCNTASQMCLNTKGNFTCTDKTTQGGCPPGFKKNSGTFSCEDINECEENEELCGPNETCVNESGGHTCVPNAGINANISPPINSYNFPASKYTTPKIISTTPSTTTSTTERITESTTPNTVYVHSISRNPTTGPYEAPRNPWRDSEDQFKSDPRREYQQAHFPSSKQPELTFPHNSSSSRYPYHQIWTTSTESTSLRQPVQPEVSKKPIISNSNPERPSISREPERPSIPRETDRTPTHREPDRTPYRPAYKPKVLPITCPNGFAFSQEHRTCIDINECLEEDVCDSTQDCINTHGSYYCNCKRGFTKDITGACADINECQIGTHNCSEGQRCDNTIGSFYCPRIAACGTGYTLNHANNICEDDDECSLGSDNCKDLGQQFQCKNTLGSYRCEKIPRPYYRLSTPFVYPTPYRPNTHYSSPPIVSQQKRCLPGYIMTPKGDCEDIDECKNNPCSRTEKCLNLNGRYQCISKVQCKLGFELNEGGTECVDIDECTRGTHQCSSTQICKNGFGYHVCTCPPGHKLNENNHCEDINECQYYRGRACSSNAECINTIGSFECRCNDGLRQTGRDICDDIDECSEMPGLCQQKCVNLWANYRCSCDRGYSLNSDNRTCADIDECEKFRDQHLCIGTCQNTAGSYACSCPRGYRLGSDGRTCQDVDECLENVCGRPDATCLNTRGNYKCFTIDCPPHYIRDPDHKSRCKRAKYACDQRDQRCLEMPQQYSYHFMTFISKLPILQGHIDFFQMRGPVWVGSTSEFNMKIINVNCPEGIEKVHDGFFRMNTLKHKAILALVRSIEGPQEIELQLELKLYYNHIFNSKMVARIYLIVSQYPF